MIKKQYGQYFTKYNPFKYEIFKEWCDKFVKKNDVLLEPFAGSNNIINLIIEAGINNHWECYDIDNTQENAAPQFQVIQKDTIKDFPNGFNVCITNPPYLAKNSAKRMKLPYPDTHHVDLYLLCLEIMLNNCPYVAAIIPESYITSGLFFERLYAVISLNKRMFDDTDCPVCLALFAPIEDCDSPKVYVGDRFIGTFDELSKYDLSEYVNAGVKWVFNDKDGSIGVKCIDDTNGDDIKFFAGENIDPNDIKVSSRAFTRIGGLPEKIDLKVFIDLCNQQIQNYREKTQDVFLTSFKGLRKDNKYRRRMDFKTIKCIMNKVILNNF